MAIQTPALDALATRQQELAESAMAEGRVLIRAVLARLEARFPRHKFRYLDGMGTMTVYCAPAISGDRFAGRNETALGWGLATLSARAPALAKELEDAHEEITETAATIGDTYRVDFGEITTTPDAEEITADATPAEMIRDAATALGITMSAVFVPFSVSRNAVPRDGQDKPWQSLNWRVTLERNGRAFLTTDYSAGAGNAPAYNAKMPRAYNGNAETYKAKAIAHECETGRRAVWQSFTDGFATTSQHATQIYPEPADVISSLVLDASVLDSGTFEQWASELGYDTDSRAAESTYRECLETALKLRAAIGEAGIDALRTAAQDY